MKKSIFLVFVLSSLIYAKGFVNPLPNSSKSIENGGTLSAIDAYQDGVGAMVIQDGRAVDNSSINALVFKYGNAAKSNSFTVGDQVLLTGTPEDKLLAKNLFVDGSLCNDGNALTFGETWLNGICQGGVKNGTPCVHSNHMIIQSKWLNGICQGGVIGTMAGNGLIYDGCEGGHLQNTGPPTLLARDYCSSNGMRIPTLNESTAGSSGINGVPSCPAGSTWSSTHYTGRVTPIVYNGTSNSGSTYIYNYTKYYTRCVK